MNSDSSEQKTNIIFHHYWQSPVAHKVRAVFGIKQLNWHSVEIPRVPPKPMLMPLTGGYRRTPVLQIGADIYCDSRCIIRELETRHPQPTLYPGGGDGMVWAVSRWTDDLLFKQAISIVLGSAYKDLPPEFVNDRFRLYFGPDFDAESIAREVPHALAQVRAQLGWMNERLATGRQFMLGDAPGLPDALAYYLVWFLHGRYSGGPDLIADFSALSAWQQRMEQIGHGESVGMSEAEALQIALDAEPIDEIAVDENDPQGFRAGATVAVAPEGDGGDAPVVGELVIADLQRIAVRRQHEQVGNVVVHFPRVGYRLQPA